MTTDGAGPRPRAESGRSRRPALPGIMEAADDEWEPWSGPEPVRGRLNRSAIAAFVFGLFGGVLAPIFGLVALVQLRRRSGERGKGFAVAGLVLFGVWALAAVLLLTAVAPRAEPEAGVRGLRVGDCFRAGDPTATQTAPEKVTRVACTEPHDAELLDDFPAYERYADEAYPGVAELSRRAETHCRQRQASYILEPLALPAEARLRWYVPSRIQWPTDPRITCYLTGGTAPLTRPLRADATVLRPEQLAYLTAVRDYTEVRAALVAEAPTATPTALRDALKRTETAHTGMWFQLRGENWPAAVRPSMEKLLTEMEQDEPSWRDADTATDPAVLLKVVAQAQRHPDPQTELAVRQALGLPTAQGEPVR
ncbi:DUF4190 domain-containing protein [Micromonospora sp. DT47]|uniref:DUF4190 domain-containing protein n=1 Tax=Micromonospora sp. DT47 TaxID=3393431 RepID=UPI003CE96CBA